MDKFGRFLGRISVDTCLKIDYFKVVNPPKLPSARGSALKTPRL